MQSLHSATPEVTSSFLSNYNNMSMKAFIKVVIAPSLTRHVNLAISATSAILTIFCESVMTQVTKGILPSPSGSPSPYPPKNKFSCFPEKHALLPLNHCLLWSHHSSEQISPGRDILFQKGDDAMCS